MRYRNLSGRALAAATSTALILTLSACGSDSGGGSSASSDLPEEGATVEPSEFVDDMKAGLEASTTATMTMNVDAGGTTLEATGQVDYSSDPADMQITSTNPLGDGEMQIVLVDGVMYLNQGSMTNDKFLVYDLSAEGLPPGLAELEGQMDPLAAFKEFEPAVNKVTFEGEDEVGGEELAHYVVLLDPSKMESFQGLPAGGQLPEELEYDLYFDDEFRIRQMNLTMDAVDLEVGLSEWGEPVDITAPPKDQTVDPSQMQGLG